MFKNFFTVLLLVVFVFTMTALAGKFEGEKTAKVVTQTDEELFSQNLKNVSNTTSIHKLPNELGRTWYDYACNNITAVTMTHAYGTGSDGIHFTYMKRQPDAAGTRYVTYDYWDNGLAFFFGNQSVTENWSTGWGRVINGKNDEALISFHGGGDVHLWQDVSESGYSFTEMKLVSPGVFPGFAVKGDTVVLISNLDTASPYSFVPNDIQVSTDYMGSWTTANLWPLETGATEYGPTELWPTFDAAGNLGVLYGPNATAGANQDGQIKWASSSDLCANWTTHLIFDDASTLPAGYFIPGKETFMHIQNFDQFNGMY